LAESGMIRADPRVTRPAARPAGTLIGGREPIKALGDRLGRASARISPARLASVVRRIPSLGWRILAGQGGWSCLSN
jgi:hypothetical protein